MSDLSNIVAYINTQFTSSTGQFKGKPFQKGTFHGLVKQVGAIRDSKPEMLIISYDDVNGTDGTEIVPDNKLPWQSYHRVLGQEIIDDEIEDFFGDDDEQKIVTFTVGFVVFVDRYNVELSQEELVTAIGLNFPKSIKPSTITGSQFSQCGIKLGKVEDDGRKILQGEYGRAIEIPMQYVILKLEYDITIHYNKSCFTLC